MDSSIITLKRQSSFTEKTDFTKCIIRQTSGSNDHEFNHLTQSGISTFKNALDVRKDDVYDRLWQEIQTNEESFLEKKPRCHRGCRSKYTHKKELERYLSKKPKMEDKAFIPGNSDSSTTRFDTLVDNKTCCFICNKRRDPKGRWQLILVATNSRQQTIYDKARYLNDEEMLIKIQGYGQDSIDMIAADFRYHKSCMDNYMNRKVPTVNKNEYDFAFCDLVEEISDKLIKQQSVFYTSQLLRKYREYLLKRGVNNVESYRSDRLEKRLLDHFGSDIQIVAQRGKSSLVCSSSITVQQMCAFAANLQRELHKCDMESETEYSDEDVADDSKTGPGLGSNDLFVAAKHLREKIKQKEKEAASSSLEISYESASKSIPDDLFNYLAWTMFSHSDAVEQATGRVALTETQQRKVLNVAQEIMGNTTSLPMPKHVGISMYILKQTGSKEVVRVLNKFGNATCYEDTQRYITAQAHQVDLQTDENGVFIPTNVYPGRFTQCAFDNLDFKENTKDGTTLHATSHAIYQYVSESDDIVQSSATIPPLKSRRRTIDETQTMEATGTDVGIAIRREARSILGVPLASLKGKTTEMITDETFVWTLIRLLMARDDIEELTPTWSTFNEILAGNKSTKPPTVVAYGPLFPDSPTNPEVVQSSLDYFMLLTSKLGQQSTVVTVDQSIYDIVKGMNIRQKSRYALFVKCLITFSFLFFSIRHC